MGPGGVASLRPQPDGTGRRVGQKPGPLPRSSASWAKAGWAGLPGPSTDRWNVALKVLHGRPTPPPSRPSSTRRGPGAPDPPGTHHHLLHSRHSEIPYFRHGVRARPGPGDPVKKGPLPAPEVVRMSQAVRPSTRPTCTGSPTGTSSGSSPTPGDQADRLRPLEDRARRAPDHRQAAPSPAGCLFSADRLAETTRPAHRHHAPRWAPCCTTSPHGHPPFEADNFVSVISKHLSSAVSPPAARRPPGRLP